MEDPCPQDKHSQEVWQKHQRLPPTPPRSASNSSEPSTPTQEPNFPLQPPTNVPEKVLDIDKKTPDAHVPRDPRLIRLTGTHPLNAEAPLPALFAEGFLTTQELFYVRNHGAVPEVQDAEILDWHFVVEGWARHSHSPCHVANAAADL